MKNLLLLHGAIGSKSQLLPLAGELENTYNVHLINFSGHGGEDFTKPFSIAGFSSEVLDYMDKNNLEEVSIFGYSMGGYVALQLAHQHPKRINKIFTLATKFNWDADIAARETKLLNPETLKEKVPSFFGILKERHAPNKLEDVLQNTADMLTEMGKNPPLTSEVLKQISCPVCISIGEKDQMVTTQESMQAAAAIPNSTCHIFPDTPHPIEKMDVKKLAGEVKGFIG